MQPAGVLLRTPLNARLEREQPSVAVDDLSGDGLADRLVDYPGERSEHGECGRLARHLRAAGSLTGAVTSLSAEQR